MSRKKLLIGLALGALVAFGGGGGAAYVYQTRHLPKPVVPAADPKPRKAEKSGGAPEAASVGEARSGAQSKAGAAPGAVTTAESSETTSVRPAPLTPASAATAATAGQGPSGSASPAVASPVVSTAPAAKGPDLGPLVRLYEGMPPKDAALVMGELDPELSTTILLGMRERQAAKVLALLDPKRAAQLTLRIARLKRGGGAAVPSDAHAGTP